MATDKTRTTAPPRLRPARFALHECWALIRNMVAACVRHRITGLAGEAAFFTLTSLPPLLLGLVGTLGYLTRVIGADTVAAVRSVLVQAAAVVLSPRAIEEILQPALTEILSTGRASLISIGFVLALWSGSAAINAFVDTIAVVYGLAGHRGVVARRLLSLALYGIGLISGIVLLPLLAVGPGWIAALLPAASEVINSLYWPAIIVASIASLTTLYALALPLRTPWREHLPGATLALLIWVLGSVALRLYLDISIERSVVYGTLAAPIGVLFWLYITALAVLLGAALNAELDIIRPQRATARARTHSAG